MTRVLEYSEFRKTRAKLGLSCMALLSDTMRYSVRTLSRIVGTSLAGANGECLLLKSGGAHKLAAAPLVRRLTRADIPLQAHQSARKPPPIFFKHLK